MRSRPLVLMPLIGLYLLGAAAANAQQNPFESVSEPSWSRQSHTRGPMIDSIEFRGTRALPQSTLRSLVASRVGGAYDLETLRRDSRALYNTGRFSNVAWETEMGLAGARVRFVVVERPLLESIEYSGDAPVSTQEIVARFKERNVTLRVETLYNDEDLARATEVVKQLVAEKTRRIVAVTPEVESLWPHSTVRIIFKGVQTQ